MTTNEQGYGQYVMPTNDNYMYDPTQQQSHHVGNNYYAANQFYNPQTQYDSNLYQPMMSVQQENVPHHLPITTSTLASTEIIENKEERILAAKQRLKQFQKEVKRVNSNGILLKNSQQVHNHHQLTHQQHREDHLPVISNISGRSSPAVSVTGSVVQSTPSVLHQQQPFESTPTSEYNTSLPINNEFAPSSNVKEQLQLHLQTIAILVAEKTDLQTALHSSQKKNEKQSMELDEMNNKYRSAQQQIADLERQLSQQASAVAASHSLAGMQQEVQRMNNELNSKDLIINELRVLLSEAGEKLTLKQSEMQKLSQVVMDLKSHLEVLKMKETSSNDSLNLEDEVAKLKEMNVELESKLERQRNELNQEHHSLVERYKKQIENLVDQINRMTDEREETFTKIDNLQHKLAELNRLNSDLALRLSEEKKRSELDEQKNSLQIQLDAKAREYQEKIDLLENEIKYFKQQIDILLREQQEMNVFLNEKEQSIVNLNKLLEKYESDREKFNSLLDQTHNDKQTISRCLKQNNDLKNQLIELQDAYVKLTNDNLQLATDLESERFKLKQLQQDHTVATVAAPIQSESINLVLKEEVNEEVEIKKESIQQTANVEPGSEWGDEEGESHKHDDQVNTSSSESIMDTVKHRIEGLERENKDLNDYITLVNKKLTEAQELEQHQLSLNDTNLKKLKELKEQVKKLESEKAELSAQLNLLSQQSTQQVNGRYNHFDESKQSSDNDQQLISSEHLKNMKLLEEKFNRVMTENVDLKEKNQELEHVVQQLQFETETIVDYITMYQMERTKLSEKYKIKDEAIRSLSTQLQVNRLALSEIYNYLNAFIQLNSESVVNEESEKPPESNSQDINDKKTYLLTQIQGLLGELTFRSSSTLASLASTNNTASTPSSSAQPANLPAAISAKLQAANASNNSPIDPKSIVSFRNETVLCSYCYGDLFVI